MIFPPKLASQWVDAWNARDLEGLLSLYADTIELRSPFAKVYARDGTIRTKAELRAYWGEVMRRLPKLKLELITVYAGHQAMSLLYIDDAQRHVLETMVFDQNDLIIMETACVDRPR